MIYDDILSTEELEALLTPEELAAFKAEQQSRLEHELMLSPAHLLLAVRELGETVGRLTARVQQLENHLAHKTLLVEPEVLHVVNHVIETALFEMPEMAIETSMEVSIAALEQSHQEPLDLPEEIPQESPDEFKEAATESTTIILVESLPSDNTSAYETTLISRSARHRERKPSLLSKLFK